MNTGQKNLTCPVLKFMCPSTPFSWFFSPPLFFFFFFLLQSASYIVRICIGKVHTLDIRILEVRMGNQSLTDKKYSIKKRTKMS